MSIEMKSSPDTERAFHAESEKGTSVSREHVLNFGPVDGIEKMAVRRIFDAITKVQQRTHQRLKFCQKESNNCRYLNGSLTVVVEAYFTLSPDEEQSSCSKIRVSAFSYVVL